MSYTTINIEGGLFSPDLLDRIAVGDEDITGQTAKDFSLSSNRHLLDEIQRSFSDARAYWNVFNRRLERSKESSTTLTRRYWMADLVEILGFTPLEYQRAAVDAGGTSFPISHRTHNAENATPVHIVSVNQHLDKRGSDNRRPPHALVQDFLNRSEALWGVATNGTKLRLLRDSARLSKPTYLEFDLQAMIEGNAYSEFVLLYRLLHATRFPRDGVEPHECLLENYYTQGIEEGGRVRDKLRDGVKSALEIMGTALVKHPENDTLRNKIRSGQLDETHYYRQLLNFVYRMLFLMVTEERKLLVTESDPVRQAVFDRYYSITSLRDRAERYFAGDRHGDLWEGLAQTFRVFREENAARKLGLTPLNGELFRESACSDIETAFCPNEAFLTAMQRLSTFDDNGVRRRVNYAHLDVEEFGSVYESLLDYRPVLQSGEAASPSRFELAPGTERKQTGSYYTPPELVRELIDSALVPVIKERLTSAETLESKEKALLALRVCDPASGSGHFLLAAARRIARELAKARSGEEEPAPSEYRIAIRDVVRNCIYAVDRNPLAVDLCKVALWIEGHAAGLPLGFLDHHIKCGDSLIGVSDLSVLNKGIPNDAYKTVTGDDKEAAKLYRKRNKEEYTGQLDLIESPTDTSRIGTNFAVFGQLDEHNPAEVQAKEELYNELRSSDTRWWELKTACDLWTYAFFAPIRMPGSDGLDLVPTTGNVRNALNGRSTNQHLRGQAMGASENQRFFHWPLEFPDVFEHGGFDVVLGNPPWERIKLQEKEFFLTRDQEIATAPNKAARKKLIQALPQHNPALAEEFHQSVHNSESTSRFVRSSERFPLAGRGDINTYPIFTETARTICSPTGRAGIIVPSGVATDDTTKVLFTDLVDRRSLVSLFDFENREKVFPGIDSRIKFCLLTLSGADRPSPQAEFAFFLYRSEQLQDTERRFILAKEEFALFNPNTHTCPVFRTQQDADIVGKMYRRAGVFLKEARGTDPEVNPWGVKFQRMFDMSNDSDLFRTREKLVTEGWQLDGNIFVQGDKRYLPLYEGKLFHQYDHRFATFDDVPEMIRFKRGVKPPAMVLDKKADPGSVVMPRYWVPEEEVIKKEQMRKEHPDGRTAGRPDGRTAGRTDGRTDGRTGRQVITSRFGLSPELQTPGRRSAPSCHATDWDTRERLSEPGMEFGVAANHDGNQPENSDSNLDSANRLGAQGRSSQYPGWLIPVRKTTNATNERTSITSFVPRAGMSDRAPLLHVTDADTAALMVAGLNSIVLDFAARTAVGGTDLSYFIIKQLPVLPPKVYLEEIRPGSTYAELILPRVLELTYTAHELQPFARDLGYDGPPFLYNEERRHCLKCELDAIFAHMYQLQRTDLEWILDAQEPSQSFPGLKRSELKEFGEYRTQRYVLQAYDQIARGELPNLDGTPKSTATTEANDRL